MEFLDFVLELFERSKNSVAGMIGDNASTNRAFAKKAGALSVARHSRKFKFAMKDMLLEHNKVMEKVNMLM